MKIKKQRFKDFTSYLVCKKFKKEHNILDEMFRQIPAYAGIRGGI